MHDATVSAMRRARGYRTITRSNHSDRPVQSGAQGAQRRPVGSGHR